MVKNIILTFLLAGSFCCPYQLTGQTNMPDVFYKCWTASSEEDAESGSIYDTYRPCNYKEFKKGMFRARIEFFKNGNCKWLQSAPNDAHFFVDGTWVYKHGKVIVRNANKEIELKFKIKNLEFNRMNINIIFKK
jgi:hypothetical protein